MAKLAILSKDADEMEISRGQGWGDKEDEGETKSEMKCTYKERQNGEKRVFHALSSKKFPELI